MQARLRRLVLEKIRPGPAETKKAEKTAAEVLRRIRRASRRAVWVGSTARGTDLRGEKDLDVFVFFPKKTRLEELKTRAVALGKKVIGKTARVHYAQHPYTRGVVNGFNVEIVPCYRLRAGEKPHSAVDRSPLHQKYLEKRLSAVQKDDVRLLKQLLKACEYYGAEQRVKGFSGYLCELLILKHDGFESLLKAAASWKPPIAIMFGRQKPAKTFGEPLVVIDPVDANRNAAAAVSLRALTVFIKNAQRFLKKPGEEFFFKKLKPTFTGFKPQKTILLSFPAPRAVEEIAWAQLEKLAIMLSKQLELNGFSVMKKGFGVSKQACVVMLESKSLKIPARYKHAGPPAGMAEHAAAFRKANPGAWIEKSRLWASRKRRFTDARKAVRVLLQEIKAPSRLRNVVKKAVLNAPAGI